MVYFRAGSVFILEQNFTSKSSSAVREAFSNVYPDKVVPNKTTIHWMITKFRDAGKCLSLTSAHRATKQLKLCEISGSHEYEVQNLLGCTTV
jgi:hypothetical protein